MSATTLGADARAVGTFAKDDALKTTEVGVSFEALVAKADGAVEQFIEDKTKTNQQLELSAGESLQLQRLMGDQSITVQTGTATLKSIKDSISSAARNI
ncbi:hypothetical protein [Vibrio parahaemolyticus]|uniref:hypothetical protein n=1 Tax=Vibrio parahaemolyticus TaxID=670 RepID=UPI00038E37C6|nr:hypothetical protein [Vibrio parahaemolyticus]EQM16173.1 hypothetical protein D024_4594 [Vibrio parahaemolyticus 3259]ETJ84909.1 hypothetical protein D041_4975 [Vibrio parahaemolyticus EKP-008]TPB04399.1 hypothetical protein DXJ74_11830 [Vibrio parahaemolyticus]TXM17814.1 hypothetical protein FVO96_23835 [Vibrio parahaemolyticus]HCG9416836.1 hypothetical protein [Vibrio parahaemolyticus]